MTDRPISVGIAGLGTVGAGLVDLIVNQDRLRLARRVEIRGVCARERNRRKELDISPYRWFDDAAALAASDDIDIFVELIGGADGTARRCVETALRRGKAVVTANKALLAEHGMALASVAEEHNASIRFEAAVCGGAPIIGPMRDILCAADITEVTGILNGTCNDVLCRMEASGQNYQQSLSIAQELGYAEADPFLDVSGTDAAHKITLLASLAFAAVPEFGRVVVQGIERIRRVDIDMAAALGFRVKLIGRAVRTDRGVACSVGPRLLSAQNPLSQIEGPLNALAIETIGAGRITISGEGAGRGPTAMAVMSDIASSHGPARAPFGLPGHALTSAFVKGETEPSPHYLRAYLTDRPGALASLTETLAAATVSIDTVQQGHADHTGLCPVAIVTHPCTAEAIARAEHLAAQLPVCTEPPFVMAVG